MTRIVNGRRYEFTVVAYLGLMVLQSWFTRRRFLRSLRRLASYLAKWLPVLALFVPLSGSILWLFVDGSSILPIDIEFELASIILSSVVLLMIKEVTDSEGNRNRRLKRQYEYYTQLRWRIWSAHGDLCKELGGDYLHWDVFDRHSGLELMRHPCLIDDCSLQSVDSIQIANTITEYELVLDDVSGQTASCNFIDWGVAQADRDSIQKAKIALKKLKQLDIERGGKDDAQDVRKMLVDLFDCDLQMLAAMRRPWSYPMDMAREELIKRFVLAHGIEIQG